MNKVLRKIFKSKGMPKFWTDIGTGLAVSSIWLWLLSYYGLGESLPIGISIILLVVGGGLVYYVNN